MAHESWTTVQPGSRSSEPYAALLSALASSGAGPEGVLSSKSGRIAVSVSLEALQERSDFEVDLGSSARGKKSLVLLLSDGDGSTLADEVRDLASVCDLVGVPRALAQKAGLGGSPAGTVRQRVASALPSSFVVWESRANIAKRLTRDAPVDIEEGPDNLAGREAWFKKRQGGER